MKTKGKGIIPWAAPALIAALVSCVGPLESMDPVYLVDRPYSLSIHTLPYKTVYEEGESADWTGLELRESYYGNPARIETNYSKYTITGFDSASPGEKIIFVSARGLSASFSVFVNSSVSSDSSLTSLFIYTMPYKTVYEEGESADWTGMEVRETYSDGNFRIETDPSKYTIAGFDSASAGVRTITVSRDGISVSFAITVNSSASTGSPPSFLSIYSPPNKQVYELGESADWRGLAISEIYPDGSLRVETDYNKYTITGFDSVSAGEKTITVSRDGVSVTFPAYVNSPLNSQNPLVELHIAYFPKQEYQLYESPNWTGLIVEEIYADGSARVESNNNNYTITGFDSSSPGVKTIIVSKAGISATFTVTVQESQLVPGDAVLISLTISSWPRQTSYKMGDGPDWSGLMVQEYYSDGSTRVESDYNNYSISGFDSSSPGEKKIIVSKAGISATFTVTVQESQLVPGDAVLISLNISSWPYKQTYELNEAPDWTGLQVEEYYSDGNFRIVSDYNNYIFTGFESSSPGVKTIIVGKDGLSATFTVTVQESQLVPGDAVLISLSINSWPYKQTYELNEAPDWTGLQVYEQYSDGNSRVESDYAKYSISGFDSSSPGVKTITVGKDGLSATFTVTVTSAALVSLFVTSLPNKLVYEYGESADWTGMVVTGTYSDHTTGEITDYETSYFDRWSIGEQSITVSKNGVSASSFTVTVRQLNSLSVSTQPTKLIYKVGDSADWTGLVVTATYSGGAAEEITDYEISGFDSTTYGSKQITVSKNYYSAYFNVTVEGLMSLSVSAKPDKLIYELGESADWTGLVVTGNYFLAGTKTETSGDYEISGFDSASPGVKTITVAKDGKSDSFTVEALPKGDGTITIQPPPTAGDIILTWVGGTSTVMAPDGYAAYQWFVDDMARPADSGNDGKTITLTGPGSYRVRITAWKQGIPYSGETVVTLP
jgi:hypothetical protein